VAEGASTMILLVTSLLISGAASVVLIESWGDVAEATGTSTSSRVADSETDVSVSGDRSSILLDTSGANQEITLYFQNTGSRLLDKTEFSIFVDGIAVGSGTGNTLYPANGQWAPGYVLEVTVADASWSYSDGDIVTITIVAQSIVSEGVRGTSVDSEEVRLSV
jgi:archaellum component FlaG (FlaF/FlaG flagellin family)